MFTIWRQAKDGSLMEFGDALCAWTAEGSEIGAAVGLSGRVVYERVKV